MKKQDSFLKSFMKSLLMTSWFGAAIIGFIYYMTEGRIMEKPLLLGPVIVVFFGIVPLAATFGRTLLSDTGQSKKDTDSR